MRYLRRSARWCRGQSTLEFVWLTVAIIAIVMAMKTVLNRAVGGRYRSSIDQLSQQHFDPTDAYNYTLHSRGTRTDTVTHEGVSESTTGIGGETSTQSINVGSASAVPNNFLQ